MGELTYTLYNYKECTWDTVTASVMAYPKGAQYIPSRGTRDWLLFEQLYFRDSPRFTAIACLAVVTAEFHPEPKPAGDSAEDDVMPEYIEF